MSVKKLTMTFDNNTIEHLGTKLYTQLPHALAEFIANAYDAKAKRVDINLIDINGKKSIKITDDGKGMDFDEINEKFLRIGRARREEESEDKDARRKVTGRKGLGKLAFFGICEVVTIVTGRKGANQKIRFTLDYGKMKETKGSYEPPFDEEDCDVNDPSTTIILNELKKKTQFKIDELAVSLSKLFTFFDRNFKCFIRLNDGKEAEVSNDLKFKELDEKKQFEWIFPDFITNKFQETKFPCKSKKIEGKILTTKKPLRSGQRGIAIYARGRLVNLPEFYNAESSSHVFSYLVGYLKMDFLDEYNEDLVATARQSLNWNSPILEDLQLKLFLEDIIRKIEQEWRTKRKSENEKNLYENIAKDNSFNIPHWLETLPTEKNTRIKVENFINLVSEETAETNPKLAPKLVAGVRNILPEYPALHFRFLHPKVREVCEREYKNKCFHAAIFETCKAYIDEVRTKAKLDTSKTKDSGDFNILREVFGYGSLTTDEKKSGDTKKGYRTLSVTRRFQDTASVTLDIRTIASIENAQLLFSQGIVKGFRNIFAHENRVKLEPLGLVSEKDCLDLLSLLSHLFSRLDNATYVKDENKT